MRPSSATSRIIAQNSCCTSGSRLAFGSSRMTSSGRCMNAAMRPTFCRLPVESSPTRLSRSALSRSASSAAKAQAASVSAPRRSRLRNWRVSRPVMAGQRARSAGRYPSFPRTLTSRGGWPSTNARPALGRSSPMSVRMRVDFPAPLGPRKPNTSPADTSRSIPESAGNDPYCFANPVVRMGCMSPPAGARRRGVASVTRKERRCLPSPCSERKTGGGIAQSVIPELFSGLRGRRLVREHAGHIIGWLLLAGEHLEIKVVLAGR